jgi:hypothetical protein
LTVMTPTSPWRSRLTGVAPLIDASSADAPRC